eukprot:353440-Chlamydomonas_euryale.AAC.8
MQTTSMHLASCIDTCRCTTHVATQSYASCGGGCLHVQPGPSNPGGRRQQRVPSEEASAPYSTSMTEDVTNGW